MQAERMAGLPNVDLVAVDFAQHDVIEPLIRQRRFMPLLEQSAPPPCSVTTTPRSAPPLTRVQFFPIFLS